MAHVSELQGLLNKARKEGWAELIRTPADELALLEGYYFDWDAARHVEVFFEEFLVLPKENRPFTLEKFQKLDILWPLFGWMRPNGTRRFRRGYIEIPKKNSKTTTAAGIGNYMLFGDNEIGAEVYCCANDQDQATILWNNSADMVEKSPFLLEQSQVVRSRYRIVKDTQSWFAAWSSEGSSKDGPNIHCAIVDELHEWGGAGRDFWRKIRYGGAARRQAICPLVITTAGSDKFSLCFEQHEYAQKLLDGIIKNDFAFFPLIYAANAKKIQDDPNYWKSVEARREANPAYEIILKDEIFLDDIRECENDPSAKSAFLRYRLGYWTEADNPWIDLVVWDANKGPFAYKSEEYLLQLLGNKCWGGLDLATTDDTASYVLAFPYLTDVEKKLESGEVVVTKGIKIRLWIKIFCPMEKIEERSRKLNVRYDLWKEQGYLIATPGNVIDHDIIMSHLEADAQKFKIQELKYDRHAAAWLVNQLQKRLPDIELEPFGQGYYSMSDPIKETYKLVKQNRVEHGGHEMFRWQASNAVVESDGKENQQLTKERSKDKIDSIVAFVMSIAGANVADLTPQTSIYGDPNFDAIKKELDAAGKTNDETRA